MPLRTSSSHIVRAKGDRELKSPQPGNIFLGNLELRPGLSDSERLKSLASMLQVPLFSAALVPFSLVPQQKSNMENRTQRGSNYLSSRLEFGFQLAKAAVCTCSFSSVFLRVTVPEGRPCILGSEK